MATGRVPTTANSPLTAKGDLFGYSTTQARVPVGSDGETLVADSSASTGLRWQGLFAAGKNKIINGDFRINQRGFSSTTTTATYMFDRFYTGNSGGTVTYSAQTFTAGTAPVAGYEAINFLRVDTTGQSAAGDFATVRQAIEDVRTFANQTITISFWAKAASGTPQVGVSVRQVFGSGGSPSTSVNTAVGAVTLSTSWARYSVTVAVPSISGKTIGTDANSSSLQLLLWTSSGTTFTYSGIGIQTTTIDFWGVQVEAGAVATPFTTATGTLAGELDACKRYAQNINYSLSGKNVYNTVANGSATGATSSRITLYLPVPMRVAPTSVTFTASGFVLDNVASAPTVTGVTINQGGTDTVLLTVDASAGALTNKDPVVMYANNNSSANLILSAEL